MISFLFKGLLRDKGRSLFPFLTVAAGVFLTVVFHGYIKGIESNSVEASANLRHGHVKVMTRAYAADAAQIPNDLALTGVGALIADLRTSAPGIVWTPRILFGGLLDIPDENGETKTQVPASALAVDLRSPSSPEPGLLGLSKILVRGRLPEAPGEILIGEDLSRKLGLEPGGRATFVGSTMRGSMSLTNFVVAGTIRFGVRAMDRTGFIADLADIRKALDMENAAGEVLGFFGDGIFRLKDAQAAADAWNARFADSGDDFVPVMQTLGDQPGMDLILGTLSFASLLIILVFLLPMSLVLWNAGLIGTLKRHGEFGVRLAIGEDKGHVYRTLIAESLMIGALGSVVGTLLGLGVSFYLQAKGIDISGMMKNISFMMPTMLRSRVMPFTCVIGFIPGLLATLIGAAIAGRGIYRRQTAQLFKELEQ